jgi:hypothetical protein
MSSPLPLDSVGLGVTSQNAAMATHRTGSTIVLVEFISTLLKSAFF